MFQDRAGTTPVTADGQTVGLILDKSKGLVLGSELVTNGDFCTDCNGTTLDSSVAEWSSEVAIVGAAFGVFYVERLLADCYQDNCMLVELSSGTISELIASCNGVQQ